MGWFGFPYLGALALIQDVTVLRHQDAKYRRLVKSHLRDSKHPITTSAFGWRVEVFEISASGWRRGAILNGRSLRMRFHNITKDDMNNGDGLRAVLWLSGCDHCCKDCQNPITWDPNTGLLFDEKAKAELFDILSKDYISGITFSGGDPLFHGNRGEVTELARQIKEQFPSKTIWLYTGYVYEQIKDLPVLAYVDVLAEGPFEVDKKDNLLHWVGSSNQRVIDMNRTRECGKVVLHVTEEVDTTLIEKKEAAKGCCS